MGKVSSLSVASCLVAIAVFSRSNVQSGWVPEVAVLGDDGKYYIASSYTRLDDQHYLWSENAVMDVMVTDLGDDRWKLDLRAKRRLRQVYFPFQTMRTPVAPRPSDEIFYYPHILGLAEKASARDKDWDWGPNMVYPGQLFAPLVVLAGSSEARMVAATNWPPKEVTPLYGAERLTLLYEEEIPTHTVVSYECMIVDVKGAARGGMCPGSWRSIGIEPGWIHMCLPPRTRTGCGMVRGSWMLTCR